MRECVLDASVGVKWFSKEALSDKADYLLDRLEKQEIKIVVPEFFFLEIANVFQMKVKQKQIDYSYASQEISKIMHLSLDSRLDREFADIAMENAIYYSISVYDALYVSLAETYLIPLVTADEKLVKTCRAKGFDFIESLEALKLS